IKCLTKDIVNSALTSEAPDPHVVAAMKNFESAFRAKNYTETQRIVNEFIKFNQDSYTEFEKQLKAFMLKLFSGQKSAYIKIAEQLLTSLPIEAIEQNLKRTVLALLLIVIEEHNKKINIRTFTKLSKQLSEINEKALYAIIFSEVKLIEALRIKNTKSDKAFLVKIIQNGVRLIPSSSFKEWVNNYIKFEKSNTVFHSIPHFIISLYSYEKLTINNIKLMLDSKLLTENDFKLLLVLSINLDDSDIFKAVTLNLKQQSNYQDANLLANILIEYIDTKDAKALLNLPKEVRDIILKGTENQ
ncbi:MAG: hypothetical protein OQK03_13445, partial [Colwellia sp.]|nr:hypothetical protein [Colwellia sp.]